jgi:hypothetical protein
VSHLSRYLFVTRPCFSPPLCFASQAGLRWHAVPPLINDLGNFGPACIAHASEHQVCNLCSFMQFSHDVW